jgi:hypothetical protein
MSAGVWGVPRPRDRQPDGQRQARDQTFRSPLGKHPFSLDLGAGVENDGPRQVFLPVGRMLAINNRVRQAADRADPWFGTPRR